MSKQSRGQQASISTPEGQVEIVVERVRDVIRRVGETVIRIRIGAFDEVALAAVRDLGDSAYGVSIIEHIEPEHGRVSVGRMYATLARLESAGLIRFELGEVTAERGGRRKRYVRLTVNGERLLDEVSREQIRKARSLAPA